MKSGIVKRSIVVHGHKTSVSPEHAFWRALKDIARARDLHLGELIGTIDTERTAVNLSSMLRLCVLNHYRDEAMRHQAERVQTVAVP